MLTLAGDTNNNVPKTGLGAFSVDVDLVTPSDHSFISITTSWSEILIIVALAFGGTYAIIAGVRTLTCNKSSGGDKENDEYEVVDQF
mmetsp:Transcript_21924/g.32024  ORF Transcript_21924/g.32024 Transcript_21924/m.32024 type:complete len:87 (+) Transcript_21924:998-1258(+)